MKIYLAGIIGYALAAYFLTGTFVPRIRMRWGIRTVWTWRKSGLGRQRERTRTRLPKMSELSCFGLALFIGALTRMLVSCNSSLVSAVLPVGVVGFVLGIIGNIKDTRGGTAWKKY